MNDRSELRTGLPDVTISEDDIYSAMKEIPGYLDITPGDFKELYVHAYQHALQKIAGNLTAEQLMNRKVIADKCQDIVDRKMCHQIVDIGHW